MKKIALMMLIVFLLFALTGCLDEELAKYSDVSEIRVETFSANDMARITIVDTYMKNNMKYYVFKTDITGNQKFTLSEIEYDEYIGLRNDAVDCTIYKLCCYCDVFSYKFVIFSDRDLIDDCYSLWSILDEITEVEAYGCAPVGSSSSKIYIKSAYGQDFREGDYSITASRDNLNEIDIVSEINVTHYSFMGEGEFKEEINDYMNVMDKLNKGIVDCCSNAIENDI